MSAHWDAFHDSQSLIRNYVYFVGSSPNGSDLVPPTPIPADHTSFLHVLATPLPSGSRVYTTVLGYNRAGLSSRSTSNGVVVDADLPASVAPPLIDTEWVGSGFNASQPSSSAMRITWNFTDNLSMYQYFVSVESDSRSILPVPPQTILNANSATLSRLSLSDGSRYRVTVIGCDLAGLCASSSSPPILVDSSPPIDGYFAVASGSVANLSRTVPGGMTWRDLPVRGLARLNLAFVGFLDPHSQIREYWATVGTTYSADDLLPATLLTPSLASNDSLDIYLARVTLNRQVSDPLYIYIWAVNGAGLRSHIVQASFGVESGTQPNNGSLVLLRSGSCSTDSCLGHCTCAARGQLCNMAAQTTCSLPNALLPADRMLRVYNTVPQLLPSLGPGSAPSSQIPLFTSIIDKLYGRWEYIDPTSQEIERVEWSVGIRGQPVGEGLIDVVDGIVWRDAGSAMSAVFSVAEQYPVVDGEVYVFHVRAWYSSTEYSVFSSEGVVIDIGGPGAVRGSRVRDGTGSRDRDFSLDPSTLSLRWYGVFSSALSGNYSTYELGIGNLPGSDNIYRLSSASAGVLSADLSGLPLEVGVAYYSVVRATNALGVSIISISDGIVVDTTAPEMGVVLSGWSLRESIAQTDTGSLPVRWYGFSDVESDIEHYEVAISNITSAAPLSLVYSDVGIGLQTRLTGLTLVPGQTYFVYAVAMNRAGLRSRAAVSRGVAIQDQRPEGRVCAERSDELLTNPSFENSTVSGERCPRQLLDVTTATYGWELDTRYVTVASLPGTPAAGGCFSVGFLGSVSQYFPTIPGVSYLLSFSYRYTALPLRAAVRVQLPGVERLLTRPHTSSGWHVARMEFIPDDTVSLLMLSSALSDSPVYIDDVTITRCNRYDTMTSVDLAVTWPNVVRLNYQAISSSKVKLSALWDVVDAVSGIREYWWAIGTVPGGEQLQLYQSTGPTAAATSRELRLAHGQEVHVTVVAWSNAGTQLQVHSGPYWVDLTPPPSVGAVWDGTGEVDIDYQDSRVVGVNWSGFVDRESGLDQCSWAIGMHYAEYVMKGADPPSPSLSSPPPVPPPPCLPLSSLPPPPLPLPFPLPSLPLPPLPPSAGTSPGSSDVQQFLPIASGNTTMTSELSNTLLHGLTVYSTVVCSNRGGLASSAHTDGVTILPQPPTAEGAYISIASPSHTAYPSRRGYLSTSEVTIRWDGFAESANTPLQYEVRVLEGGVSNYTDWTALSSAKMLSLSDVDVSENASHMIQIRAINLGGVASDSFRASFFIASFPPQDTGM